MRVICGQYYIIRTAEMQEQNAKNIKYLYNNGSEPADPLPKVIILCAI